MGDFEKEREEYIRRMSQEPPAGARLVGWAWRHGAAAGGARRKDDPIGILRGALPGLVFMGVLGAIVAAIVVIAGR